MYSHGPSLIFPRYANFVRACWRLPLGAMLLALLLTVARVSGQTLPKTEEETLSGEKVNLQSALSGKIGILVLGFSQKSKEQSKVWGKGLLAEFRGDDSIAIFQMPVLEAVPRLVRSMVLHGMKKDVPAEVQPHFLPVLHNEQQWKELTQFSAADDAYILVVDREQKVVWRDHGPWDPARNSALVEKIGQLSKTAPERKIAAPPKP
jgi:hypothetical protein